MHKNLTSYLKFLLKSTNQHGVHSPFVFDLVTKCLYQYDRKCDYITNSTELKTKNLQVVYRLLTYLKPATIQIIGEEIDAFERIFKTENIEKIKPSNTNQKIDCFLFTEAPKIEQFEAIITKTHNDSFCILLKQNPILLQAIKQNKAVSVTVDCFDLLLVFFQKRASQRKFYHSVVKIRAHKQALFFLFGRSQSASSDFFNGRCSDWSCFSFPIFLRQKKSLKKDFHFNH